LHVYGSQDPALTDALRKTAERGAHGWPLWLWRVDQRVLADTELTPELMRDHDVVLYGTPSSNTLLSQWMDKFPIKIEGDAVVVGDQRYRGRGVGTKFVYPNPLQPNRYVLVQAAPTLEGVQGGHNLPDFLPDYVVYDATTTRSRPRLLFPDAPRALGYFDVAWQLDPTHMQKVVASRPTTASLNEGNGPESAEHDNPPSPLPVPSASALETPPLPQHYATAADTQAGKAAREIARRVTTFTNYRIKIPGATWLVDERSPWSIREKEACLADLAEHGITVEAWPKTLSTPVASPVQVRAAVSGVTFRFLHAAAGAVISCEMAARLRDIAEVVARHGVHTVHVLSAYRDHPYPSFHTLGLALDLSRFDTDAGPLVVATDFVIDRARETCAQPGVKTGDKHAKLQAIACALAATHRFSSVLTPNYNAGHRDHFHVDIRPDDPRLFVR
jgi:hypothetical protein